MAVVLDERALDERLARLEAARSWSPRLVSRLEALLRDPDDAAVFRVNPFTFARQRDDDEQPERDRCDRGEGESSELEHGRLPLGLSLGTQCNPIVTVEVPPCPGRHLSHVQLESLG